MAQPLSFLFNVHAKHAEEAPKQLVAAFSASDPHPLPNIVHYLWAINMPDQVDQPPDTKSFLLTTVYDEDFKPYVQDIAREHHCLFDQVLPMIVGMEGFVPVLSHLDEFADFILAHDLTNGGKIDTFLENYRYSVLQIWGKMG